MQVTWVNYVHDRFHDRETPAGHRQKHLVLDMPSNKILTTGQIREISPRLAVDYATKTERTVKRDLNDLIAAGLIRKVKGGYMLNNSIVEAFLPIRAEQ